MSKKNNQAAGVGAEARGVAAILEFMQPGVLYGPAQIAAHISVTPAEVRRTIAGAISRGLVETRSANNRIKYSLAQERPQLAPMKPLKISREMHVAMERCKELRVHPSNFGTRA
jgi:hypothetical protein